MRSELLHSPLSFELKQEFLAIMLGATAARADDPALLRGQAQGLETANSGL